MTTASPDAGAARFVGARRPVFRLALLTGVWTLLTAGIYRFWARNRLRRWYWSAIRPGGLPLEYTGHPVEKLLGFLIAVTILAFYLGLVNLGLMFASFSLFSAGAAGYAVTFAGVIPLWFFARYRARRYMLSRTRWRGIRFGVRRGAWGYAALALWCWLLTLLSLGLLWPRMTFKLEKYRIDRTTFGTQSLRQGGTWYDLYPAFTHALIGGFVTFCAALLVPQHPGMLLLLVIGVPWLIYGIVDYRVKSLRILARLKEAGPVTLRLEAKTGPILRAYLFGYLGITITVFLPLVLLSVIAFGIDAEFEVGMLLLAQPWGEAVLIGLGAVAYFAAFVVFGAMRHAFVTLPVLRHYAQTLEITGADALGRIGADQDDAPSEAEGFAEALDVGAAI